METVSFTVYGKAAPAGSKTVGYAKTGRAFVRDSSGRYGVEWRANVQQAAGIAMHDRRPMEGPLALRVRFELTRPKGHYGARGLRPSAPAYPMVKPDILKLTRAVEDAMTGIVYRDDAQIVWEFIEKAYGEQAVCEVTVTSIEAPVPPAPPVPVEPQLALA